MSNSALTYLGRTDVGIVRDHNEDAYGCFLAGGESAGDQGTTAEGGDLIAVLSDGVGGHEAGELASNATVAAVGALLGQLALTSEPLDIEAIRERIETAMAGQNQNLRSVAKRMGQGSKNMAATLTAAWLAAGRLLMVHAGDSRLYRWREGKLKQLSVDDTYAGRAIARGEMTEKEAKADSKWHVLQRAMGIEESKFAVSVESFEVEDGDVYLLCSDGLTDGLTQEQLKKGFGRLDPTDLPAFRERLIEAGNQASGKDNITVTLIQVGEGWKAASRSARPLPFETKSKKMNAKQALPLYALVVLCLLGLVGLYANQSKANQEQAERYEALQAQVEASRRALEGKVEQIALTQQGDRSFVSEMGVQFDLLREGLAETALSLSEQASQLSDFRASVDRSLKVSKAATDDAWKKAVSVSEQLDGVWARFRESDEAQESTDARIEELKSRLIQPELETPEQTETDVASVEEDATDAAQE